MRHERALRVWWHAPHGCPMCRIEEYLYMWYKIMSDFFYTTHRFVVYPFWASFTGWCVAVGCSVLQRVAVCCSVVYPFGASFTGMMCCSVLQCVAVCCSVLQCVAVSYIPLERALRVWCVPECCSLLQRVAVCCSVVYTFGASFTGMMCCSVLQCVAACCSVLQCRISLWSELYGYDGTITWEPGENMCICARTHTHTRRYTCISHIHIDICV